MTGERFDRADARRERSRRWRRRRRWLVEVGALALVLAWFGRRELRWLTVAGALALAWMFLR